MGTYVYNLRKRTLNVTTADGTRKARFFSYAYKEWFGASFDRETERRRDFIRDSASRVAEAAWAAEPRPMIVISDGKPADGDIVCVDLQRPIWYDTDKLPARQIGWLRKIGNRWMVVDGSPWEWSQGLGDGVQRWTRQRILNNGTIYSEEEIITDGDRDHRSRWGLTGHDEPGRASDRAQVEIEVVW